MSRHTLELEELRQLLREEREQREIGQRAKERAELQAQKAEEEKQKAEEEKQKAEEEKQKAEERTQEERQRNQRTTFKEFLQACHEHLHKPLRVETNKSFTTKGLTNPAKKYYPNTLSPWKGFSEEREDVLSKACKIFHPSKQTILRLFSPVLSIEDQGRLHCNVRLANEASLRNYEKIAVEAQVTDIINRLCEIEHDPNLIDERDSEQFQLGQGFVFENDPNSLGDVADEVQERLQIQPPRTPSNPSQPDSASYPKAVRSRADQYGIYKDIYGKRELLFVVEYKPPHKLSIGNLMGFREMDLKEVINRVDIPPPIPINETGENQEHSREERTEEGEAVTARLQYNADKVTVAVATQTFHYMIENGLEYSYITTGEAFVFLHVKADDPTTLYYHVTVPTDEVNYDGSVFPYQQTAIGQVLSLCLMASESEPRDQEWRREARKKLEEYPANNLETVLQETPASERKLAAERKPVGRSPPYKGGRKVPVTSQYNLRSKCKVENLPPNPDDGQDDPDAARSPTRTSASNSRTSRRKPGSQQKDGGGNNNDQASHGIQRQYCTQGCLLGIVCGSPLDRNCPNASRHPILGEKHAVDQSKFLDLVQKQLTKDLDHNCEPLGLQGARGALFRITLASHGYVFVGKGTVQAFVPDLLHEGNIYRRLARLQGRVVPVCLGNIDLTEWYYLDVGVRILHMLLMSWGGELADEDQSVKGWKGLQRETQRTIAEVQQAGIDQMDVRPPNLLWNREAGRVMLIDFERAKCIGGVLEEISPNKKRKLAQSSKRAGKTSRYC